MSTVSQLMNLENPMFRAYLFYCSLLVLKMLSMSFLTAVQRFKNKAFANPEDAANMKLKPKVHEDVERVRRAHLNDLENIPAFMVISWIYMMTNPNQILFMSLLRFYTIARYVHTLVYAVVVVPQPARALAWFAGMGITAYMTVVSIMHFMK